MRHGYVFTFGGKYHSRPGSVITAQSAIVSAVAVILEKARPQQRRRSPNSKAIITGYSASRTRRISQFGPSRRLRESSVLVSVFIAFESFRPALLAVLSVLKTSRLSPFVLFEGFIGFFKTHLSYSHLHQIFNRSRSGKLYCVSVAICEKIMRTRRIRQWRVSAAISFVITNSFHFSSWLVVAAARHSWPRWADVSFKTAPFCLPRQS
jgi:hypothetical protein